MQFDQRVFKANDIRGTYPEQLSAEFAFMLGSALAAVMGAKRVAVGFDCRLSSPDLCSGLTAGLEASGAKVKMLGLCPAEILYYAAGSRDEFDLGIFVTASHNPPQFNGFKIVARGADPITEFNGLAAVREWMSSAGV